MDTPPVTVVELPNFIAAARGIWDDSERAEFIDWIARNPEAGDVIPGAGGVRKVRWAASGRGKRGGARVIYYFQHSHVPLFLLTAYTKNERADLTMTQRATMARLAAALAGEYTRKR